MSKSYVNGLSGPRRISNDEIVRLYLDGGDSDVIGQLAGCSGTTVRNLVRRAGGAVRGRSGRDAGLVRKLPDAEIARHYRLGYSGTEIADLAACSSATVYNILARVGVERRAPGRVGK